MGTPAFSGLPSWCGGWNGGGGNFASRSLLPLGQLGRRQMIISSQDLILSPLSPFPSNQQTLFRPLFMSTSVGVCLSAMRPSCLPAQCMPRQQLGLRFAAAIMEMGARRSSSSSQVPRKEGILMEVSVTDATLGPSSGLSLSPASHLKYPTNPLSRPFTVTSS